MRHIVILVATLLASVPTLQAQITAAEKQALQDLYNATNGPSWATQVDAFTDDDWDFTEPVTNDWYGVTVANGHLVELDLEFNELVGTIPSSIGDLVHLTYLNLSTNELTGNLPDEIGNLTDLNTLNLSNNELSGSIPTGLGNLLDLNTLRLGLNNFNGPIPPELGNLSNLATLRLTFNKLNGTIPQELGNLSSLISMDLSSNELSGTIPLQLTGLNNLKYLTLWGNNLSGNIPSEIGNMTSLSEISLQSNEFSGTIPIELSNLQQLTSIRLGGNNLTGTIPSELSNLINLGHLSLGNNLLTGPIPVELGNSPNLNWLALHSNQLSGTIPDELGNLSMIYLDLYDNMLSGPIPPEITNNSNIFWLALHSNQLTGVIPPELGNLTNLSYLSLYENQLTGTIPPELSNLSQLEALILRDNLLSGNIPTELANMTSLKAINFQSNQLSGTIPPELGNLPNLTSISLRFNAFEGPIPSELGNLQGLTSLNLDHNNLSGDIPSEIIDQTALVAFSVDENRFDFGNLEYTYLNAGNDLIFAYSPQQKTDTPQALELVEGNDITLSTAISGTQNHYQWFKDGQPIDGAPDSPDYEIVNATFADAGTYHCIMTSDIVNDLILTRHDIELSVELLNPGEQPEEENWNIITVWDYDLNTDLRGNTRKYYDDLGKHVQTQDWNPITNAIWGQVTMYDYQGRPALSSLSAPIPGQAQFQYHASLLTNTSGDPYETSDFEDNPFFPVGVSGDGPIAQYYSGITSYQYQDKTTFPFSRTIFSELIPGTSRAFVGGNKVDTNGDNEITDADQWPQAYSFTMPATNELGMPSAFGDLSYAQVRKHKTVTRDVHGNETVVFTDTDGKLLAMARSGEPGQISPPMKLRIGAQGYVDVHIPQGINTGISTNNNAAVTVYNLITDAVEPTPMNALPPGFYRVAVNDAENYEPNTIAVDYRVNYHHYSLNKYDEAGRLVAAYQPVTDGNGDKLVTTYRYNTLGQLVGTKSPDEGTAQFKYRNDGQIRYSQNREQELENEVSYTDYDRFARPVESGVLKNVNFVALDADAPLPQANKIEVTTTRYDFLDVTDNAFLSNLDLDHQHPSFLAGNVAKTANAQNTTYYSYDGYGRVKWLVQHLDELGTKTIDYTYEPRTGQVQKVTYQKGQQDQFVHRYAYNNRNQLVVVETSLDGEVYELQATYTYNEACTLVRTEIAGGLQGIDYVYNLAGQLKSMNHPSLDPTQDPGGDANDLFGMQLDYHTGDYRRTENPNITTAPQGRDQFNGNIKGIRWRTKAPNAEPSHYTYSYDRNNWLTGADFDPANAENEAYDVPKITYDANGNIQKLVRNKNAQGGTAMDDLIYNYDPDRPNRLLWVDDGAGDVPDADDLADQSAGNYMYNTIGQLIFDHSQHIAYIYNASGLVTEVRSSGDPVVKFFYNDRNQRVKKEHYAANNFHYATTYYVRDVAGQVMAVYNDATGILNLTEQPIYGAGRIGIAYNGANDVKNYVYEMNDHLGNVRAVFMKDGNDASLEGYTDYYPFGMPMPAKSLLGPEGYRYAFQGQEKDPETGMEAFELRLWDSRIGRWLTTDPYGQYASPYLGMGNNPISMIDADGGFADCPDCDQNAPLGSTQTDSAGFDWTMQDDGWARTDGFEVAVYGISKETQNYWAGVNSLAENLNRQKDLETGKSTSIRMLEELERQARMPQIRQFKPKIYASSGALEYVGTGGISLLKFVKNPHALRHIFRNAPGHVNPTTVTSQNRYLKLFSSVASDTKNLVQTTNAAKINANVKTFHRTFGRSGKQVWVETINGKIVNAGVNNIPR